MGRTKKTNNEVAYKQPFPKRLRELLDRPGETQGKLAESIGVNRQSIGQWKDGITSPDINVLNRIADYYNVSTDYLLGRTEVESTDIDLQAIYEKTGLSEDVIKIFVEEVNFIKKYGGKKVKLNEVALGSNFKNMNIAYPHESFRKLIEEIIDHKDYEVRKYIYDKYKDFFYEDTDEEFDLLMAEAIKRGYDIQDYSERCFLHEYQLKELLMKIVNEVNGEITKEDIILGLDVLGIKKEDWIKRTNIELM